MLRFLAESFKLNGIAVGCEGNSEGQSRAILGLACSKWAEETEIESIPILALKSLGFGYVLLGHH